MLNNIQINTGATRSVPGHLISGTLASSVIAGAMNYNKYKKSEITKKEFINNTIKTSLQGGIATASAVAASNYIGEKNLLGALGAISAGVVAVYGTEKVYDRLEIEVCKNKEITND